MDKRMSARKRSINVGVVLTPPPPSPCHCRERLAVALVASEAEEREEEKEDELYTVAVGLDVANECQKSGKHGTTSCVCMPPPSPSRLARSALIDE